MEAMASHVRWDVERLVGRSEMNAEVKASSAAARPRSSTSSWSPVPDCENEDVLSQPGWMEQRRFRAELEELRSQVARPPLGLTLNTVITG